MELNVFFKSVIDADRKPVVICDLEHTIIYMNPSAVERYAKRGGAKLLGKSLLDCHNADSVKKIKEVTDWFARGRNNNLVYTFHNTQKGNDYDVYMVALRDDDGKLIGYYEKHEDRIHETMPKYDLKQED